MEVHLISKGPKEETFFQKIVSHKFLKVISRVEIIIPSLGLEETGLPHPLLRTGFVFPQKGILEKRNLYTMERLGPFKICLKTLFA